MSSGIGRHWRGARSREPVSRFPFQFVRAVFPHTLTDDLPDAATRPARDGPKRAARGKPTRRERLAHHEGPCGRLAAAESLRRGPASATDRQVANTTTSLADGTTG